MPRTFAGRVPPLLAVLVLLAPGKAPAGPPEGASGKMVLESDRVSEALWQYRRATSNSKRMVLLEKLVPTCDPRVGLALGELLHNESDRVRYVAGIALACYYRPHPLKSSYHELWANRWDADWLWGVGREGEAWADGYVWWLENKANLRRRAARLPR